MAIASFLLIAGAFGLTAWQYEQAQKHSQAALADRTDQQNTGEAAKVFWHEREAINEYLLTRRPHTLREIDSLEVEFLQMTADLADGEGPSQARSLARLRAANNRLVNELEVRRDVNPANTGAQLRVYAALRPYEEAVLRPLRIFREGDLRREHAASAHATSAAKRAHRIAILGAFLALMAGIGFALYASRLLRMVGRHARAEALHEREHELRQAQKMEAVGRLAGGVAHDFNNILLTITGYSDLASADVRPDQAELRDSIDQIKAAAILAATLTGKLLAFSRQQIVQPRVVDLSAVVEDLAAMLQPLLGEEIELVLELEPSQTLVEADPGQLEQVVMNLVINARDAMPEGGRVAVTVGTLDVAEHEGAPPVPPGRYVRLAVSDTGTGMEEETISRALDPFFTTKELGEGTGLGLATVHGVVTQSGGDMEITSALGEGTTFSIYLPCAGAALEPQAVELVPQVEHGSESVLLVEDVDSVRSVLRKILERGGYDVIATNGGAEAIESLRTRTRPVDLLVTDMVMPGMSGRELSRELVALYPELRVIYMSGHTQDVGLHHDVETGQVDFLQKPFSASTLVDTAREVLGRPRSGAAKT